MNIVIPKRSEGTNNVRNNKNPAGVILCGIFYYLYCFQIFNHILFDTRSNVAYIGSVECFSTDILK